MRVLVVVPTYQEAANVVELLRRLRAAVPDAGVLVVDDASPDGTAALAAAAAREVGGVEVLRRPGKVGLASAYLDGFRRGLAGGAEVLVEMDADLSHDPSALPALLEPVEAGRADLVLGSRYVPGGSIPAWSWHRRALSRWGNRYAAAALALDVADATSGYRAYRADLLRSLELDRVRSDGYGFQIEMVYRARRAGARVEEVPISFTERVTGRSKMSGRIVVEALALVTVWALRDRVTGLTRAGRARVARRHGGRRGTPGSPG